MCKLLSFAWYMAAAIILSIFIVLIVILKCGTTTIYGFLTAIYPALTLTGVLCGLLYVAYVIITNKSDINDEMKSKLANTFKAVFCIAIVLSSIIGSLAGTYDFLADEAAIVYNKASEVHQKLHPGILPSEIDMNDPNSKSIFFSSAPYILENTIQYGYFKSLHIEKQKTALEELSLALYYMHKACVRLGQISYCDSIRSDSDEFKEHGLYQLSLYIFQTEHEFRNKKPALEVLRRNCRRALELDS